MPSLQASERQMLQLQALSESLTRLAVQQCNIADVSPLTTLQQLQNLNLAGNAVPGVAPMQGLVGSLPHLHTLDVRGNPLCKARSYRCDLSTCDWSITPQDEAVLQYAYTPAVTATAA